jgi:hypothetical protein
MRLSIVFASMVVAWPLLIASAQPMVKCVGPDGRVSYSDRPCQAGARPGDVTAPSIIAPTSIEQAEAQARLRKDKAQAERMARERRAAERTAAYVQSLESDAARRQERTALVAALQCEQARQRLAASNWSDRGGIRPANVLQTQEFISRNCGP